MKFHACWIQFCHTLHYFYRPHFLQNANNTPFQFAEYSTIPVEISDLPNLQPCQNLGVWLFYNMTRNLKIFTYHKLGGHVDLRPLNGRNALWLVETLFLNDFSKVRRFWFQDFLLLRTKNWETNGADFTFFFSRKKKIAERYRFKTRSNCIFLRQHFWGNFWRILISYFRCLLVKVYLRNRTTIAMFSSNSTLLVNH